MTTPLRFKLSAALLVAGLLAAGGAIGIGGPADQVAAQDKAPAPRAETPAETPKPAPVDLVGGWRLALPAGFEYDVKLTALPDDRFRFAAKGLVFNGVYECKDGRLVMAEPVDKRQTGFEWEIKADGRLVLVRDSDAKSGDYLGATLTRADTPAATKPAAAPPAGRGRTDLPVTVPPAAAPAGKVRVSGWLVSTEYGKMSGTVDRFIVYVLRGASGTTRFVDPDTKKEAYWNAPAGRFTFDLPPGTYRVQCTGVGSRGATFEPTYKEFTVKAGDQPLALGAIDLPVSEVTKLFGKPAPELDGVVAWKNTDPLTLKGLKGQVVVIDFWSYACSICHHYKPDLVRLADRYKGKGVTVITLHDNSVSSVEEMDKLMEPVVKHTFHGKPLGLPIGIDGRGKKSVFQAFGVYAVPTALLIDQDGKVVRRFAHAGDPDLEAEVAMLLERK
jgi:thiol-disulfide isomerase/thioredoxin